MELPPIHFDKTFRWHVSSGLAQGTHLLELGVYTACIVYTVPYVNSSALRDRRKSISKIDHFLREENEEVSQGNGYPEADKHGERAQLGWSTWLRERWQVGKRRHIESSGKAKLLVPESTSDHQAVNLLRSARHGHMGRN